MIWALLLAGPKFGLLDQDFYVSHLIRSPAQILRVCSVTRDGQFYGSEGYMWPSDGSEGPYIARKGKAMQIDLSGVKIAQNFNRAVGWKEPNTVYIQDDRTGNKIYACTINTKGKALTCDPSTYQPKWSSWPTSTGSSTYRPLDDPRWSESGIGREFLQSASVEWYPVKNKFQVGNECMEIGMVDTYGTLIRLPSGRMVPFRDQLRRLKGLNGMRLIHVGREGWFVIEVANEKNSCLVWIEPKVKRPQKNGTGPRR